MAYYFTKKIHLNVFAIGGSIHKSKYKKDFGNTEKSTTLHFPLTTKLVYLVAVRI